MPDSGSRPERISIHTELGRTQSLAACREAFTRMGAGRGPALFLGLGPCPWRLPDFLAQAWDESFYVECPACESQMPARWREAIPAHFRPVQPRDVLEGGWSGPVFFYDPGLKHFPSFWGPLWAKIRLDDLRSQSPRANPSAASAARVILPGTPRGLLVAELARAFTEAGFTTTVMDPSRTLEEIPELLSQGRPELFFSINFQGLDAYGRVHHLLRAAGVAVAAWCVDNPFHLTSGLRSPFWKDMPLFVTDDWFLAPLARHGAIRAMHLPLAAGQRFLEPGPEPLPEVAAGLGDRVVFVGRSEFPGRRGFFAGCQPPADLAALAGEMVETGGRPHFGWWVDRLGLTDLWPGNEVRTAGCGADEAGRAHRVAVLSRLSRTGRLTVFGDDRWADVLPGQDCRGPLDYYGALPAVYAASGVSLNVTGLLLPHGLTQRHFDVWAAGGLLMTDDTPGLALFPEDLRRETVFPRPDAAPALAIRLFAERGLGRDLSRAWRAEILARHTYGARAAEVLNRLELCRAVT
ncbi:MAG: glycosyltransferase family protein [Thermodesulfobacteriota bacterium]